MVKCGKCNKEFEKERGLSMHEVRMHSSEGTKWNTRPKTIKSSKFSCKLCSKSFFSEHDLRIHNIKIHKNNSVDVSSDQNNISSAPKNNISSLVLHVLRESPRDMSVSEIVDSVRLLSTRHVDYKYVSQILSRSYGKITNVGRGIYRSNSGDAVVKTSRAVKTPRKVVQIAPENEVTEISRDALLLRTQHLEDRVDSLTTALMAFLKRS